MKRLINASTDLTYSTVRKLLTTFKRSDKLHYDKIAQRKNGVRLAYSDADERDDDYDYLETADLPGSYSLIAEDDDAPTIEAPFYIRIRFEDVKDFNTNTVRTPSDSDFKNVLPEDLDVMKYLASHKVFPTLSTSRGLRSNPNYDESEKYIELVESNEDYNVYAVPYGRNDFFGSRIFDVPVTVYRNGEVAIYDNAPIPANRTAKLAKQFSYADSDILLKSRFDI